MVVDIVVVVEILGQTSLLRYCMLFPHLIELRTPYMDLFSLFAQHMMERRGKLIQWHALTALVKGKDQKLKINLVWPYITQIENALSPKMIFRP